MAATKKVRKPRIIAQKRTKSTRVWGNKHISVEISDKTGILLGDAFSSLYPGIVEAMEDVAFEIYNEAFDKWPIRTGFSQSQLDVKTFFTENKIEVKILANAPYTKYIHEKAPFSTVFVWQELLLKPQKEKTKKLIVKIEEIVKETWGSKAATSKAG